MTDIQKVKLEGLMTAAINMLEHSMPVKVGFILLAHYDNEALSLSSDLLSNEELGDILASTLNAFRNMQAAEKHDQASAI